MEDYKMPNHEQWIDWLGKHYHNYYLDKYSKDKYKEIVIHGTEHHDVVLSFNDDGELIAVDVC